MEALMPTMSIRPNGYSPEDQQMSTFAPPLRTLERFVERPWPLPARESCRFYHAMTFPDGESVSGEWDIRSRFDEYIGGIHLAGKTVLDIGTASAFLAFSAEQAGAKSVTALDVRSLAEHVRVPFAGSLYHTNKLDWASREDPGLVMQKNGFWYAWHKLHSGVRVAYTDLDALHYIDERFDVVLAGAIIEHLSDPITAIGLFCRVAGDVVSIAFTPVLDEPGLCMRPLTQWHPERSYVWWALSRDLYVSVFNGLGFDVQFRKSSAIWRSADPPIERPTIVATRR